MSRKIWSDLNVLERDDFETIKRKLDEKLEQLIGPDMEEALDRVLAEAKVAVERAGGDWDLNCKSIQNLLQNLRDAIKHAMIPDDVISMLPGAD